MHFVTKDVTEVPHSMTFFVVTFYRTGIDLIYWVEQADDRFLWNKVLMQELIEQKVRDLKFIDSPELFSADCLLARL